MSPCWLVLVLAAAQGGWGRAHHKLFRKNYHSYPDAVNYLQLHDVPATWDEARLRCSSEGSVLASPLNKKLETAIWELIEVSDTLSNTIPHFWVPGRNNDKDAREECQVMSMEKHLATVSCNEPQLYVCYRKEIDNNNRTCGTTDPDYVFDSRTSHCYKFHRVGQPWPRALMTCSEEGGYLVVINSEIEAEVLKELIHMHPKKQIKASNKKFISVGYRDWNQDGMFMTIDGQQPREAGYDVWDEPQPAGAPRGACGAVSRDAALHAVRCDQPAAFVCEIEPAKRQNNTAFFVAPKIKFEVIPKEA